MVAPILILWAPIPILWVRMCVCVCTHHGETIFTCKIIRPWILNYFQILWDSLIQEHFICDFHIMTCACTLHALHDGVRECAMFSYQ